jgi:hypothetical protein
MYDYLICIRCQIDNKSGTQVDSILVRKPYKITNIEYQEKLIKEDFGYKMVIIESYQLIKCSKRKMKAPSFVSDKI